jgi:hypothetical protein
MESNLPLEISRHPQHLTIAPGDNATDEGLLCIDSRSLHRWLAQSPSKTRVLLAHHPLDWLCHWAKTELERTIADSFQLVLTGHLHTVDSFAANRSVRHTVFCAAPALFTRKNETLGYTIIGLDTDTRATTVRYRQWADQHRRFVAGAALAGSDTGTLVYNGANNGGIPMADPPIFVDVRPAETLSLLRMELDEALINYSTKQLMWVERDLANIPETNPDGAEAQLSTPTQFAANIRDAIIRAPREFGLTCIGKKIAYEYHSQSDTKDICLYVNAASCGSHRRAVESHINFRLEELHARGKRLSAIVVDGWTRDAVGKKLATTLRESYGKIVLVLLEHIDLGRDIERIFTSISFENGEILYLWALRQNRIRELVEAYVIDIPHLNATTVTSKIIKDIDSLNIFRTPQNCLLFLRLAEQAFDESPVNRTELIHRVLFLLFYQFNEIPTYASRPDLMDCEYVLGYFCEWMLKESKQSFTKHDFFTKSATYCQSQIISVEIDVLLTFLISARIVVISGAEFRFRFSYWLHYFAAHRMHHDPAFAEFILSERRYATIPEIVEFYTGIDRRRVDAIKTITKDLEEMATAVSERTNIKPDFDPFSHAKWQPTKEDVDFLRTEVSESIANSSLPAVVKDSFADQRYDRARPYSKEVAQFVDQASLRQMFHATRGAARALRNSDHVPPPDKLALLNAILKSWNRVAQVLAVISPVLAEHSRAACEGMSFVLAKGFDLEMNRDKRWSAIMECIPFNVVNWFEDDLYSSKLGPLIYRCLGDQRGKLSEILLLTVLIRQRPEGWAKEVKQFITRTEQDSFGLLRVFTELRIQRRIGFISEAVYEMINHLSATSLAKHEVGSDDPNRDAIRSAAKALGYPLPPSSSELRHSKGPSRSNKRKN